MDGIDEIQSRSVSPVSVCVTTFCLSVCVCLFVKVFVYMCVVPNKQLFK